MQDKLSVKLSEFYIMDPATLSRSQIILDMKQLGLSVNEIENTSKLKLSSAGDQPWIDFLNSH